MWDFIYTDLQDGLYQVKTGYFCAGFIVEDGVIKVNDCAPILRRKIHYWITKGIRI